MLKFAKKHQLMALFLCFAAIELFSFFGFLHPLGGIILFFLIAVSTLIVSLWRPEYGLLIVLAELFIGSKGYLFSLDINGMVISIRIALFLVIMAAWIAHKIF